LLGLELAAETTANAKLTTTSNSSAQSLKPWTKPHNPTNGAHGTIGCLVAGVLALNDLSFCDLVIRFAVKFMPASDLARAGGDLITKFDNASANV